MRTVLYMSVYYYQEFITIILLVLFIREVHAENSSD